MRVALIGLGRAGSFHLRALYDNIDMFEITMVVDCNYTKATEMGRTYRLPHSIRTDDIPSNTEAVIIATSTKSHYDMCKKMIEKYHVFIEKPLAEQEEQIGELYNLARVNDHWLQIGFHKPYDTSIEKCFGLANPKQLVITSRDHPIPPIGYLRTSGGIVRDCVSHDVRLALILFGCCPRQVFAVGSVCNESIKQLNDYDNVVVTMVFPEGKTCTIFSDRLAEYGYDQRVEIYNDKECLIVSNNPSTEELVYCAYGVISSPISNSFPDRYRCAYAAQLRDFAKNAQMDTAERAAFILSNQRLQTELISVLKCIEASIQEKCALEPIIEMEDDE